MIYREAGVDIDAGNRVVDLIRDHVRATFRPEVLADLGFFGGLFALGDRVLVASADGVGTKLKIAFRLGRHDTVGFDLVHHCVNDILTCGAEPLFFLDYFATGKLDPEVAATVIQGIARACQGVGCALLGGETAELPGFYQPGEYDLAGFIVGLVARDRLITGQGIRAGDAVLGLPSSGLHTNGYSLVRRVFRLDGDPDLARATLERYVPELGRTLGEELLEPHRCYWPLLRPALPYLQGLAHITGGGLLDNIPRVLPAGLAVRLEADRWEQPPIFRLIARLSGADRAEMYRVFNMGLGMVLFVHPEAVATVRQLVPEARLVGEVVPQRGPQRVEIVGGEPW